MGLDKGYIHVYTGPGKGKTTAALGLGLRAAGAGLNVYMVQFMKGRRYSELDGVEQLNNFTIVQFGRDEFVSKEKPDPVDVDFANKGFAHAKEIIVSGTYDVVILDEINVAIDYNLLPVEEVVRLIDERPATVELVLTGRYAPPELVRIADVVTEMLEIKHPFQEDTQARKGIDF